MQRGSEALESERKSIALKKGAQPPKGKAPGPVIDVQEVRDRIAAKAFELYERRGCTHGRDQEDWFEAERLVMRGVKSGTR